MSSNSGALTVQGPAGRDYPGFVQQGQVDWVAFGNTVYSASLATLQRFASANVQPTTHGAGLALASQFRMSELGHKRIEQALQHLKYFAGFEKVIYFGFGVQSYVRLLGDTRVGMNCVALCSCLVENHNEAFAAWVLSELWKALGYPHDYEPSQLQFLALVKACAGVMCNTTFGATVSVMLPIEARRDSRRSIKMSAPKDIAIVLEGLFKLSRGMSSAIDMTLSHISLV